MNRRLDRLMLAIIAVGPAHMGEQLMFGIEEFYMLRDGLGGWYAMFPAAYADHATVLLITIVVTAISLMFYALMRGGTAVLLVAGLFGLLGIHEAHHWIEALGKRAYDPGLLTSFAYVGVGLLITVEVVRELKQRWRSRKPSAATA
jgi:hypothetical protein